MFKIEFTATKPAGRATKAVIHLDDFWESLNIPLDYWKRADYEQQWMLSLSRLAKTSTKEALVVEMYDPAVATYIQVWTLYRIGRDVYVQNAILFSKDSPFPSKPSSLGNHILDRETCTEDGEEISEWHLKIDDINDFLNSRTKTDLKVDNS